MQIDPYLRIKSTEIIQWGQKLYSYNCYYNFVYKDKIIDYKSNSCV